MSDYHSKIYDINSLLITLHDIKQLNKKIVFTNGCFDILHIGHLTYLQEAKKMGDFLIVAVNSDESIKRIKGTHRPIVSLENRMGLLAGLAVVDAVIAFDEDTPSLIIDAIVPDVLVKGGDWNVEDIVGSKTVIDNGGIVKSLELVQGISTSHIEEKIINTFKDKI